MDKEKFLNRLNDLETLGGDPMFYELLLEIAELHARKNHDYASTSDPLSNLTACEQLGVSPHTGVMIRLQDKWSRLIQLTKKQAKVKDESIDDTHQDSAVYHLLAIIVRRQEAIKQLIEPHE